MVTSQVKVGRSKPSKGDAALQVGDLVELKSGGPKMTVTSVQENAVSCRWYNEPGGRFEGESFPPATLKRA